MDEWFCQIAGREIGPLSLHTLKAMVAKGEILPTDSVRRGLTGNWVPAGRVQGLFESSPLSSAGPPSFFASPQPNVAWPTEPPVAPIARPPAPPLPLEEQFSDVTAEEEAVPLDVLTEPIGDAEVSDDVKSFAAMALARRQRQRRILITISMLIVVCGLAVVGIVLATVEMKGIAVLKEGGGLERLSKKIGKTAASDGESKPVKADEHVSARPSKKPDVGSNTTDTAVLQMGIGNCMVQVVSLIPANDPQGTLDSQRLLITIEVKNLSGIEELDFAPWSRVPDQAGVKLSDDLGNIYLAKPIDASVVLRKRLPTSIAPGKSVKDVVAFEIPDSNAKLLELDVSGAALGASDSASFKIPVKMIAQRPLVLRSLSPVDANSKAGEKSKKRRKAEPGTPAGDFGLFDDEESPN